MSEGLLVEAGDAADEEADAAAAAAAALCVSVSVCIAAWDATRLPIAA